MEKVYQSNSENQTEDIAKNILNIALENNIKIITLDGDLGVGKTRIAKGIGKALNILEDITSPTFSIVEEYIGDKKFYHLDIYRIEDENELIDIGFFDFLDEDSIILIEWSKNIAEFISKFNILSVNIEKDLVNGEFYRRIRVCY